MASPAKTRKAEEDAVEGFIHSVSPRRQSKRNSSFFTAVIQSARGEFHRVVVFAMKKESAFRQAEKNGSTVRLRNVRRSLSFSDPGGFDVLCSAGTRVEAASLPFLRSTPPSSKRLTVAEIGTLGPGQKVEVLTAVSGVVTVNGSDCELKEVWISDTTGEMKLTLWDTFINDVDGSRSYSFKNVTMRQRDGCICLTTGPSCTVEQIGDVEGSGAEAADRRPGQTARALLSAKFHGIQVTIPRRCSGCQCKQTDFQERSDWHRCEGCRLKQTALSFVSVFGGKATVLTDEGSENVMLTNSALTRYLCGAGLASLFNDVEAVEYI